MATEMEKEIGRRLAEFAVETKFEDIPKEVIEFTKGLTLKTVAGMLVGSKKPSGQKMTELIKQQPLASIDYISIADAETLDELETVAPPAVISLAVKVGQTRLIDNIVL